MSLIFFFGFWACPQEQSEQAAIADEIMQKVEQNLSSENRTFESTMVIHMRRGKRTVRSKSWSVGDTNAFTEYLAPPREKGVKMLKLGDQLWLYSPSTDRTILISGHMLRQSVMGSDLSYEDMMEDPDLNKQYDAQIVAEESIENTECWVLLLKAKVPDLAYQSRKIWVDKARLVPLKEELFAKSGQLLKQTRFSAFKQFDTRWYPTHVHFKDMLKKGEGTEFILNTIEFDTDIPDHIFSKAGLRR